MNNVTANTSHSGKRCFAVAQHDKEGVRLECGVGLVVLGIDASLALCMTMGAGLFASGIGADSPEGATATED